MSEKLDPKRVANRALERYVTGHAMRYRPASGAEVAISSDSMLAAYRDVQKHIEPSSACGNILRLCIDRIAALEGE